MSDDLSPSAESDWLDELLSEEPAYIDDAGFSTRVVAALPVRSHALWLRGMIFGLASLAGVFFLWTSLPAGQEITTWTRIALHSAEANPMLLLMGLVMVAVAAISAALAWVLQGERRGLGL